MNKPNQQEIARTLKELMDIEYALDQSSIVSIVDNNNIITYVNDKFLKISKYSREELLGQSFHILDTENHENSFLHDLSQTIKSGQIWSGDIKNRAKDGTSYWVKATIIPFLDEVGQPYQSIYIGQDISAQKEYEQQILYNAHHDELTNLKNRRRFNKEMSSYLSAENNQHRFAVIFLDLDRFKFINDTLGHSSGDQILKSVSERLKGFAGERASLFRFGGDEFVILFKHQSTKEVELFAHQIKSLFTTPFELGKDKYYLSASLGISIYPTDGKDVDTLVKNADSAMYQAKDNGNGRIVFYTDEMRKKMNSKMQMENDMRQAINQGEFSLHYQPQVNLRTGGISGVEALIRWNHPTKGNIPPLEFIPLAEETGLIIPISEWVIETACLQMKEWLDTEAAIGHVAVNLSPFLFETINIVETVKNILAKTQLEPHYLELEITESIMQHPESANIVLQGLKELGVSLSVDDFGTGYSSLAHLRQFPIDILKIDRSFIQDISKDNGVIVKTIIDMALHLGVDVIAEGIETQEQLDFLSTLSCDVGQGYLFSPPLPREDLYQVLQESPHQLNI